MAAARIYDIGVAIDIFSIRVSIYKCLGPHKDGFYGAQKVLVNSYMKPVLYGICIKRNSVNFTLCGSFIMLYSIYKPKMH
jgi:hypothetical protein